MASGIRACVAQFQSTGDFTSTAKLTSVSVRWRRWSVWRRVFTAFLHFRCGGRLGGGGAAFFLDLDAQVDVIPEKRKTKTSLDGHFLQRKPDVADETETFFFEIKSVVACLILPNEMRLKFL